MHNLLATKAQVIDP